MADGFYSKMTERIRQLQAEGTMVIKRDTLANYLDLSEMDRDELESRCKQAIACCSLYQNGFRSVMRGEGLFIDYQNTDNPVFLKKLTENSELDADQKRQVANALKKITEKRIAEMPDYAQFAMGVDSDGNMRFYEEITSEEIIEMLERLAV